MSSHYIVKCRECKTVMSQCRCPASDKKEHFELCDKCKQKNSLKPGDLSDYDKERDPMGFFNS